MSGSKIIILKSVTIFMIIFHLVESNPSGPPNSVCDSMEPGHYGSSAQNSQVPFQLVPEAMAIEVQFWTIYKISTM